jgi:hypothetical protein
MAHERKKHEYKLRKALASQTLLTDHFDSSKCRARVRVYTGSGQSRYMGGVWVQCSKRPRPGKKTCFWHRRLEDADE